VAIPRGRRIEVGGRRLRWSLSRPYPRWSDPDEEFGPRVYATLTVQGESGRVAQCGLVWRRGEAVRPEAVAMVVRMMFREGWDPSARGPAFRLGGFDPARHRRYRSLPDVVALSVDGVVDLSVLATRENVLREVMES